jgi:nitroimidazol reductase NimA-like FMN-containing flavoprotein (pyridoxamine 5'-phosphate oxidase superfamily)
MSGFAVGTGELTILAEQECVRRLMHGGVGRVAIDEDGCPVVLPVNFVFSHGCAWMRTGRGVLFAAATALAPACLEIDGLDPLYHGGWNVVARGTLEVPDAAQTAIAQTLPLTPWVRRDEYIRLVPTSISGRRLIAPA